MKRLGEKLRLLRQKNGWTVREFAKIVNLRSHGHVTDIEKGRTKPSLDLLEKLADLYEVSYDQLLNDECEV